jgi:hypothetical protein
MKSSPITNNIDFNYCVTLWLSDLTAGSWVNIFPGTSGADAAARIRRGIVVQYAAVVLVTAFDSGTTGYVALEHSGSNPSTIAEMDVKGATPGTTGYTFGRIDRVIDGDTETLRIQRTETGTAATTGKLCVFLKLTDLNPLVQTV